MGAGKRRSNGLHCNANQSASNPIDYAYNAATRGCDAMAAVCVSATPASCETKSSGWQRKRRKGKKPYGVYLPEHAYVAYRIIDTRTY
eukprot:scaffold67198_cov50-Attheya_sp.AAC.1